MKIKKYNLIEITLSIGILAIGITAIMSLFPLGLQETKGSIAENYSCEAADSMLAFIARESYNSARWNELFGTSGDTGEIHETKPTSIATNTDGWTHEEGDIYSTGTNGVYGLKVTSGNNDDIVDFTGEVLIWKKHVENIIAAGENIPTLPYSSAVALILEVSWPVEMPYSERIKKNYYNLYYLELFNHNQI